MLIKALFVVEYNLRFTVEFKNTYRDMNKMADILQTTLSKKFSWEKTCI